MMCMIQDLKQLKTEDGKNPDPGHSVSIWRLYFSAVPSELPTTDTPAMDTHVTEPEKTGGEATDTASHEGREKEEKSKEDESSLDVVSVHVEAALGAVELLLYSDMGEVTEINVKGRVNGCIDWLQENIVYFLGVAVSVNMQGCGITVQAG